MTTIRWSPEAAGELDAVLDYLIERNPDAASNLAARILDAVDSVAARQFAGPAVTLLTGERCNRGRCRLFASITIGKARFSSSCASTISGARRSQDRRVPRHR